LTEKDAIFILSIIETNIHEIKLIIGDKAKVFTPK
jgi:hypothetical protein